MNSRNSKLDVLGRIPYASLIALMLCWIGVSLFCAMMYQAITASIEQVRRYVNPEMKWLDRVRLVFTAVAVVMIVVGLVLLSVGAMATGSTRTKVYTGWRARLGGRISCAIFLVLTYALHACWLLAYALCAILAFVYVLLKSACDGARGDSDCLDFTSFGAMLNGTNVDRQTLKICDGKLREFCAITDTVTVWYLVGCAACAAVLLSLVHFMICLAANYAHIKDGSKYVELTELWQADENEVIQTPMATKF